MCCRKALVLLFFISAFFCEAFATHIVGGEIYYECIGNNNYLITLKVYRDCLNGEAPYDDPATISVYNSSGAWLMDLQVSLPGSTPVPPIINNPCLQYPPNICVEEAVYVAEANLPPIPGGYHLAYQRCCRNGTILNLSDPGNAGATYYCYIPDQSVVTCNSSPSYTNFPPIVLCAGDPLNFDHSATDPDGDVLVYELCEPYTGASALDPMPVPAAAPPYQFVGWNNPYSGTYPLASSPALVIDANTGLLTGTPNTIGQFVVAVCVSEYRNGVLLSVNKRDFQFNVMNCTSNVFAAIPSQTNFCDGLTVEFSDASTNGTYYHWDFGVIPVFNDTSDIQNPSFVYPDTGTYTVTLVVNPGYTCADTTTSVYEIYPNLQAAIAPVADQCFLNNSFSFQAAGQFGANAVFAWDFGGNASPQTSTAQNPVGISFNVLGLQQIELTISENNCSSSATTSFTTYPQPVAAFDPEPLIGCAPYTVQFTDSSVAGTTLQYVWTFGDGATSTDANPIHIYELPGVYDVGLSVITTNGCIDTNTFFVPGLITVNPQPIAAMSVDTPEVSIFDPEITFFDNSQGGIDCWLYPGDGTDSIPHCNYEYTYLDTGNYTAYQIVVNELGCTDTAYITVRVNPEFRFFVPNAFTPDGDGLNDIFVSNNMGIKEFDMTIYNRWGQCVFRTPSPDEGWDGRTLDANTIAQNDVYVYYIRFRSVFNKEKTLVGAVTLVR
jgi:gliding motility-associated-like protein